MADMTLEQVANELRITARHGASLAPQACHYLADAIDAAIAARDAKAKSYVTVKRTHLEWLLDATRTEHGADHSDSDCPVCTAWNALEAALAEENGNDK